MFSLGVGFSPSKGKSLLMEVNVPQYWFWGQNKHFSLTFLTQNYSLPFGLEIQLQIEGLTWSQVAYCPWIAGPSDFLPMVGTLQKKSSIKRMLKISDCSPQLHALMVGAIAFRWQDLQHCPSLTHALFPSHWGKHRNLQLFSHSGIKNKTNFLIVMFFLTVAVSTHIREIRVSVNNLKKKKK